MGKQTKGLVLALLALIAIVVVVVVSGRGDPSNDEPNETAHLSYAKIGMTEPQIRQIFGDPDSVRHSETDGERVDTWRYTALRAKFVFQAGRLKERSR